MNARSNCKKTGGVHASRALNDACIDLDASVSHQIASIESMTSPVFLSSSTTLASPLLFSYTVRRSFFLHIHPSFISNHSYAATMPTKAAESGEKASTGEKHQTEHNSPQAKRAKTEKEPTQTTLDGVFNNEGDEKNGTAAKEEADDQEVSPPTEDEHEKTHDKTQDKHEDDKNEDNNVEGSKAEAKEGDAILPSQEKNVPSNVLEKGIIYFFIRGRVGIDTPGEVNDVARSFIILRPISKMAKLGDGPVRDAGNTRLLALPKKVLPQSGQDRFMMFVEKSSASSEELKEEFLASNDYETKTVGTRHTPAATPVGEGVYVITTTGRESHLAYMLSLPEKLGSAQEELGLKEKA